MTLTKNYVEYETLPTICRRMHMPNNMPKNAYARNNEALPKRDGKHTKSLQSSLILSVYLKACSCKLKASSYKPVVNAVDQYGYDI